MSWWFWCLITWAIIWSLEVLIDIDRVQKTQKEILNELRKKPQNINFG